MPIIKSKVLHRSCINTLPTIKSGEGMYLIDNQGKRYLDACGGAAVSCLGHSNAEVKDAIRAQLDKVAYAHTSFFTNDAQEQLADHLLQHAADGFSAVYFISGGSEAVETSLKLAAQYYYEKGEKQRKHVIARRQSYHGNTLAALSVGGNLWRRKPFENILLNTHHIAPCYAWRDQHATETEQQYSLRVANELEQKIIQLGAENVLAFVAEPVVGATAGAVTATDGYFKRIREICDQYDILLILDEIMCGMGRTGELHACTFEGIRGDIQCIAKGIATGYQALGAVLIDEKIEQAFRDGSGIFYHGHTYIGHPTACAAGLATQQYIQDNSLLSNVREQSDYLFNRLHTTFDNHPHVGDIRGRGLFIGIELVEDRGNKRPFDHQHNLHAKLKKQAFDNQLMIYPTGGTIDGKSGDHILLAPPFIMQQKHADMIIEKLSQSIDQVISSIQQ